MPARKHTLKSDPRSWDRADKLRLLAQFEAEEAAERAADLESQGWRVWYGTIIGNDPETGINFVDNLAPHHVEAIEWHWNAMIMKRAGLRVTKNAYPAVWSRSHRKSNIVRAIVVADACIMKSSYCLYVSGTKSKVRGHAISVESLIGSDNVAAYYPKLRIAKRGVQGGQKSWTADMLYSEGGAVFHFIGLNEGVAGANIDNVRPTLIVLDDVDDRDQSPMISESRFKLLTRSVLPTGTFNTLVFVAQNYINRHGAVYRIHTGKERVLTDRVNTKPIPAFNNFSTEQRTVDGIIQDTIVTGEPTWEWFNCDKAQEAINRDGLAAFLAEYQHEVNEDRTGLMLPEYDDAVHVITWDEFNGRYDLPFNNRQVPVHWRKYISHDWGSTPEHHNVVTFLSVAAQNSPLPGTVFLHKLMSFQHSTLAGTVAHEVLNYVLAKEQANPEHFLDLHILDRASADPSDAMATSMRERVREALARHQEYAWWRMSHEAKAVRDIYRMVYSLPFQPMNPKRMGGVEQMRHYLRIDHNAPHPFRGDQTGFTRMFLIVEPDELKTPKTDAGMMLAREQLMDWRWRPPIQTITGILDERPAKTSDDVPNSLMMSFVSFAFQMTPYTEAEKLNNAIPVDLRFEELLKNSPYERGLTPEQEISFIVARDHARRRVKPSAVIYFDDDGKRMVR